MSPGKIASQAGHAFIGSFINCQDQETLASYHKDFPQSPGTKVVLHAKNLSDLVKTMEALKEAAVPHFLVTDSGHESFFNGEPTETALGFGPVRKDRVQHIIKRFHLC